MTTTAPDLEPAEVAPTRRESQWLRRVVAVLLGIGVGLVLAAGIAMLTAPSSTVQGEVGAFGGGGRGCYPTVSYSVHGETYQFTEPRDDRWCGLRSGDTVTVYYDADHPRSGRLSHYGDLPWRLAAAAAVALALAGIAIAGGRTSNLGGQRAVAWALLAAWLAALVGAALTGEHRSTADDLLSAISQGEVHEVRASGGLPGHSRGTATVELRWERHGLHYVTEVLQTRGHHRGVGGGGDVTGHFTGDLRDYLTTGGGSVEFERVGGGTGSGLTARFFGWELDDRAALVALCLFVLTLLHVGIAPEPWRATPWAWVWLMLGFAPIACPAYLLLGGPTGLFRPADPRRRLTGGWAFLLAVVVGGAVSGS
ncbi:DUF3592 domain-containing protein [Nocardioides sp. MH1]|uniref:DUF3592 domain-containing protein n=1 Tax=Nocardioides sp. MH1 TaxID=3242490 RepID=UPI00352304BF